jgi:hypothetical protein
MMKKLVFVPILVIAITYLGLAQETETFKPRFGLGFVPQYTISGGLRYDIDISLSKTSNQWLIVSPQVYWVTGYRYDHDFDKLAGTGIDVKHKIYLKPNSMKPKGYYVQYGIMFQYFSITDTREYGAYYIEDGVEYYGVFEGQINTKLYKFGGNFDMGYQWLVGDKIYFDIYAGAGIRISHNNRNDGFDTWYNDHWYDYGYSGTLIDIGFRLGFYK